MKGVSGIMYVGSRTTEYDMPELWMSDGTAAGTVKNTSVSRAILLCHLETKSSCQPSQVMIMNCGPPRVPHFPRHSLRI